MEERDEGNGLAAELTLDRLVSAASLIPAKRWGREGQLQQDKQSLLLRHRHWERRGLTQQAFRASLVMWEADAGKSC